MKKVYKKVIYTGNSSNGPGAIPLGAEGKILLFVKHQITPKLLVKFSPYGKAIIPLSNVKVIEEEND